MSGQRTVMKYETFRARPREAESVEVVRAARAWGGAWRAGGQVGRAWPRAQAVTVTRSDTPSPPAPADRKSRVSSCLWGQPPMTLWWVSSLREKEEEEKKIRSLSINSEKQTMSLIKASREPHLISEETSRYTCRQKIKSNPCGFESLQWIFFFPPSKSRYHNTPISPWAC